MIVIMVSHSKICANHGVTVRLYSVIACRQVLVCITQVDVHCCIWL